MKRLTRSLEETAPRASVLLVFGAFMVPLFARPRLRSAVPQLVR